MQIAVLVTHNDPALALPAMEGKAATAGRTLTTPAIYAGQVNLDEYPGLALHKFTADTVEAPGG